MYIHDNELCVEADNFEGLDALAESSLAQFENVEVFKPYSFYFESLEPLCRFPKLKIVMIEKCSIGDFTAINTLSGLRQLHLHQCNFGSSLRLPGPFDQLTTLNIGHPHDATASLIGDVSKFASLENLSLLASKSNSDTELNVLSELTQLKSLGLSCTGARSLNFIAKFAALETLFLDGIGESALESSLAAILALPNLRSFSFDGAELNLEMDLSNLGKLETFRIAPHTDNNLEVLISWESLRGNAERNGN